MTSQIIVAESTQPQQSGSDVSMPSPDSRIFAAVRHLYKSDHQAEYLDINAQIEVLQQQLQAEIQTTPGG